MKRLKKRANNKYTKKEYEHILKIKCTNCRNTYPNICCFCGGANKTQKEIEIAENKILFINK